MNLDFIDQGNHTDVTMHTASEHEHGGETAPGTAGAHACRSRHHISLADYRHIESCDEHEDPDEEAPEEHALASRDSPLKIPPKRRQRAGKLAAFKELPVDVLYEVRGQSGVVSHAFNEVAADPSAAESPRSPGFRSDQQVAAVDPGGPGLSLRLEGGQKAYRVSGAP